MLTEVDICAAMVAHLRSERWVVHQEVPLPRSGRRVDILAIRDGILFGIEAKKSYTRGLQCQAQNLSRYCDRTGVIVSSIPKCDSDKYRKAAAWGFCFYAWDGTRLTTFLEYNPHARMYRKPESQYRKMLWDWIHVPNRPELGIAGSRMEAGCGLAQQLLPRVRAYRAAHPGATWREIFLKVPNHYISFSSMRSALVDRVLDEVGSNGDPNQSGSAVEFSKL